jgi:Peptidase inhibitor family I36
MSRSVINQYGGIDMKKRLSMGLLSAVLMGVGGIAVLAPEASANYDGCPVSALCLYQNQNGTGSKAIINDTPGFIFDFPGQPGRMGINFLNGQNANDQVSSAFNRSTACTLLFRDIGGQPRDSSIVFLGPGQRADLSQPGFNDTFSSVQFQDPCV